MNRILTTFCATAIALLSLPLSGQTPGALDPTFGEGGIVISSPVGTSSMDNAQSVGLRSSGEVVFAGVSGGGASFNMTVGQLLPDGSLDPSFGTGGIATFASPGGSSFAYDLVVLEDGKVLVAGAVSLTAANTAFAVWRLLPDGTLDATFADAGQLVVDIDASEDYARSVWVDESGQITAAGASMQPESSFYRSALIRCSADGTLLSSFGTNGIHVHPLVATENHDIRCGAVAEDGSIYLAGYTSIGWDTQGVVVRFHADGTADEGFGADGVALGEEGGRFFDVAAVGNRVLAVGDGDGGASGVIQAFDLTGVVDATFGAAGTTTLNVGGANALLALAEQADGKLLVGGSATTGFLVRDFLVARMDANGVLDPEWGDAGVVVTVIGPGFEDVNDLVVQPDGRVVAAGFAQISNNDFVFARYLAGELGAISGCTDPAACNYNPQATEEDGSCYGEGDACDDGNPDTVNDAYNADCECVGQGVSVALLEAPVFTTFPNPVQGELNIQFSSNDGVWEVRLFNASGQILRAATVRGPSCSWNLSGLPAGTYQLTVQNGTIHQSRTLLVR